MYRTILVHVAVGPNAAARIRFAADIARRFEANLIGIAAAMVRPAAEAITAGVLDASLIELEEDQIAADFKLAEQQFLTLSAESGVSAAWRAIEEFPTIALADAASAADLVIVGREGRGLLGNDYRTVDPGDLLMRAGRPVLIAPSGVSRLEALKVFVAWKNTRESRRAVFDGMPFLERAETVDLVEIRESGETDSLHDIAAFLAAHGVRFQAQGMERDASGSIEEQLSALAQRAHATLLVAGGYGHTRIRELVFGGVTRSLITSSPLPCLLSH